MMRAQEIAESLGGAEGGGKEWRCLCPAHADRNPSLSVTEKDGKLLFKCRAGCEQKAVIAELERRGLWPKGKGTDRLALDHWSEGLPIRGTVADTYLRARRGIDVESPYINGRAVDVLRFVPSLTHSGKVCRPAIVAKVEHAKRGHVATQATYLAVDGSDKAALDPPRKSFGKLTGGAIQFGPAKVGEWLALAEGIETTLSVMQSCGVTGWACLGTSGMKSVSLPPEATHVLICADHDKPGIDAAREAAQRLLSEGRHVRIAMPPTEGEDFNDVLLSVVNGLTGPERVRAIVKGAGEVGKEFTLDPKAPLVAAEAFIEDRYTADGAVTLVSQSGDFFQWERTHYAMQEDAGIVAELYRFLRKARSPKGAFIQPSRALVENVLHALRGSTHLSSRVTSPSWFDGARGEGALLPCANGLLRLSDGVLLPHSPRFFNTWAVEFNYDPKAPQPVEWARFLRSLWGDDAETIGTLQEMFGYVLMGGNEQQKMFLLIGPRRSGKGTIARVLERLVGRGNHVGLTLASLGNNFGLWPLIGKSLAVVPDARLSGRSHEIVERLLAISGGDPLTVDRKYKEAWTGQITARVVFLTNVLPSLADSSGAIASRFVVLAFKESFYGKEDHGLLARLLPELPGILNWSLEGWKRLAARGYFIQPRASAESVQMLGDLASPVNAFVREMCDIGSGDEFKVRAAWLYNAWREYCEAHGRAWTGDDASFGRDLRAAVPSVRHARMQETLRKGAKVTKVRDYYYVGIRLRPPEETTPEMDFREAEIEEVADD